MYPNWHNSTLINKSIFSEQFLKIGFSQHGEDEIVRQFFWQDILSSNQKTYLDIGCFHETLYSNTKILSLAGWSGIAIDANPDVEKQWTDVRKDDTFLNLGIQSGKHTQQQFFKFYRFKDGAINTFDKKLAKFWIKKGFDLRDSIDVQCKSLLEIADTILSIHPNFSPAFLNIDIEKVNFLDDLPSLNGTSNPNLCALVGKEGFGIDNYSESMEFKVLNDATIRCKTF